MHVPLAGFTGFTGFTALTGFAALTALVVCAPLAGQAAAARERAEAREAARGEALQVMRLLPPLPGERFRVLVDGRWQHLTEIDPDSIREHRPVLATRDRDENVRRTIAGSAAVEFPYLFRTITPSGAIADFRPVAIPSSDTLEFDPGSAAYVGSMLVGLRRTDESAEPLDLPSPIVLTMRIDSGNLVPEQVELTHTGGPYEKVRISVGSFRRAARVRVASDAFGDSEPIELSLVRPSLQLGVSPHRIPGYGLGVAQLSLVARDASARKVGSLLVTYDRGELDGGGLVALDAAGSATVEFRSSGLGTARIEVTHDQYEPASGLVEFDFPWLFLIASFAGGLAGGVIRFWRTGDRRMHRFARALLRGALTGFVVSVAYTVGVNLVGISLGEGTTEAFVFTVAMIGALVGLRLPKRRPREAPARTAP